MKDIVAEHRDTPYRLQAAEYFRDSLDKLSSQRKLELFACGFPENTHLLPEHLAPMTEHEIDILVDAFTRDGEKGVEGLCTLGQTASVLQLARDTEDRVGRLLAIDSELDLEASSDAPFESLSLMTDEAPMGLIAESMNDSPRSFILSPRSRSATHRDSWASGSVIHDTIPRSPRHRLSLSPRPHHNQLP
jgi:hypothetical protein